MAEFTRQRSLTENFLRVRVDETDLVRLARTIAAATQDLGGSVEIEVTTGDGGEAIRTADPAFFETVYMPREIASVSIRYNHYKAPLACRIELSTGDRSMARISV